MESSICTTQQRLNAGVKEEADSFPAVIGQTVTPKFGQSSGSLTFSNVESDNRAFNAHEIHTNEAILREEMEEPLPCDPSVNEDQTKADDDHLENQKEREKGCPVDGCHEKCDSEEELMAHMLSHPRPLCAVCRKTWPTASALRIHHRVHSGDKPFVCSFCERKFAQAGSLKIHFRQHTGDLPFGCDICDKKFKSSNTLKYHRNTHFEEKAFACTYCSYRCACSTNLTNHILTHTGQKLFRCSICDSCFSRKAHLERHEAAIHAGLKKHSCTECEYKTAYSSHLSRHMKKQHEI